MNRQEYKEQLNNAIHHAIMESDPILKFKFSSVPLNINRCVCCGEIIPEGRQVCQACENQ